MNIYFPKIATQRLIIPNTATGIATDFPVCGISFVLSGVAFESVGNDVSFVGYDLSIIEVGVGLDGITIVVFNVGFIVDCRLAVDVGITVPCFFRCWAWFDS
jgi:hypothetical protein